MHQTIRSLLVFFYSVLMLASLPVLYVLSWFRQDLAMQLKDRPKLADVGRRIGKLRAGKSKSVMIFVSSAGEYEQAKPLIDRWRRHADVFVHIVFFSRSGAEYAKKRGEPTSWCLAPNDTLWHWGWLFSAVSPDFTVVVRHELWPAFLHTASEWGPVYLIDAVAQTSTDRKVARWRRCIKSILLSYFARIFTVSDADAKVFSTTFGVPPTKLLVTGDTKYDRVLERAEGGSDATALIDQRLTAICAKRRRLVLGSAYPADWQLMFAALADLEDIATWLPIVVPHHIDPVSIDRLKRDVESAGFEAILWTKMQDPTEADRKILIVDQLGMLAELYASATAAYVGGALHAKVHNVLEPAVYDLAIAFGPHYENSSEAVAMVEDQIATIVRSADDFKNWLRSLSAQKSSAGTKRFVERQAGCSDILLDQALALHCKDGQMLGAQ